ncbi:MAG: hypothetical protein O3B13_20165, partial [Planctomycetota bacterium]|nr:hypothetical protein [Planctomycetota bacterium]
MTQTRREMLGSVAAAGMLVTGSSANAQAPRGSVAEDFQITNKGIRQSVMGWCFKPMNAVQLARHCREIGLEAIEGISSKDYPAVRAYGGQITKQAAGSGGRRD